VLLRRRLCGDPLIGASEETATVEHRHESLLRR